MALYGNNEGGRKADRGANVNPVSIMTKQHGDQIWETELTSGHRLLVLG